ncbi:uncharacterized protein B0T23DRAFT_429157 [Neurospora hispaniola]|uniref:Uncharacterized protein n=1 Tax=Neurospora hispaniola TaxID=588809 RepID=A0AAJ0MRS3_9PEZI|nr:hypothetical protein B0T23DRAFT_429157 [Neurospora hispaniola]
MSHMQNRDHSEQPTEQVAHSSSSNSAAGSQAVPARSAGDQMDRNSPEKVTLFTADESLSEQVASPTPENAVQSRTNYPVQNCAIQNAVEVEEVVVLPSIESSKENSQLKRQCDAIAKHEQSKGKGKGKPGT